MSFTNMGLYWKDWIIATGVISIAEIKNRRKQCLLMKGGVRNHSVFTSFVCGNSVIIRSAFMGLSTHMFSSYWLGSSQYQLALFTNCHPWAERRSFILPASNQAIGTRNRKLNGSTVCWFADCYFLSCSGALCIYGVLYLQHKSSPSLPLLTLYFPR